MNNVMLPEIKGDHITFISIYKNQFNNWNLKDQIVLTPQNIDNIPLLNVCKFKIYNEKPVENHFLVKIQQMKQVTDVIAHLYAVSIENLRLFFEKLLVYKLKSMGLQFDQSEGFNQCLEDNILKKSQFLGHWEQRHVKITADEGLTSKKVEKQKDSLHIKQTKQIWTRFQLLQNTNFIVFKIKYLLGKQQFAIPTKQSAKWIKAFYTLFASS